MALDLKDYPDEYETVRRVWEKFVSGVPIEDSDKRAYYGAKSNVFKSKFITTGADHRKERMYIRKHLGAEKFLEDDLERKY